MHGDEIRRCIFPYVPGDTRVFGIRISFSTRLSYKLTSSRVAGRAPKIRMFKLVDVEASTSNTFQISTLGHSGVEIREDIVRLRVAQSGRFDDCGCRVQ